MPVLGLQIVITCFCYGSGANLLLIPFIMFPSVVP